MLPSHVLSFLIGAPLVHFAPSALDTSCKRLQITSSLPIVPRRAWNRHTLLETSTFPVFTHYDYNRHTPRLHRNRAGPLWFFLVSSLRLGNQSQCPTGSEIWIWRTSSRKYCRIWHARSSLTWTDSCFSLYLLLPSLLDLSRCSTTVGSMYSL